MLEKVVTPDQAQKEAIQTVWEMLIEMGFDPEVKNSHINDYKGNLGLVVYLFFESRLLDLPSLKPITISTKLSSWRYLSKLK